MIQSNVRLSNEFKAHTTKAIFSIIFFALIYVLILLLAVGLTVACVYAGIMIIAFRPGFLTLVLGIGLASLGFLILIFLLKFIFKSQVVDRDHLVEIKREDEPKLFEMIGQIVAEVGTHFPKKIYLSSEVNASVFYDSTFRSMFLPVRKDLQIGIGMVNTISTSELRAILSHEFGHFSQRSMKVGSYVYHVNEIILNLLYDNESYERMIQTWGSVSGYFSIFVQLAVRIISGIQWILRKLYGVVNKSYLGLSREMEFHADAIAANVTGFEPLKTSLLRLSLAEASFKTVISFYNNRIKDNLKSENVFKEQFFVMNFLAERNQIPIKNKLPDVSAAALNKFNKSKLVIKSQWDSHPSTEERVERLEQTKLRATIDWTPANEIFRDIEQIQQDFTRRMFASIDYKSEATVVRFHEFQKEYQREFQSNIFAELYNGYYDNKNPICFDPDTSLVPVGNTRVEDLFSNEKLEMVYTSISLQNDIETLKKIADKRLPANRFDYAGKKYKREDCNDLILQLNPELKRLNARIKEHDLLIFSFFSRLEEEKGRPPLLNSFYKAFFEADKEYDLRYTIYTRLSEELEFLRVTTSSSQIRSKLEKVELIEIELKIVVRELLSNEIYREEIDEEMRANFDAYLSNRFTYFQGDSYNDRELETLFKAMGDYVFLLSRGYFLLKKSLLDYQKGLLDED